MKTEQHTEQYTERVCHTDADTAGVDLCRWWPHRLGPPQPHRGQLTAGGSVTLTSCLLYIVRSSEEVSRLAGSSGVGFGEAGGVRGVACALEYQTSCVGKAMPAEE